MNWNSTGYDPLATSTAGTPIDFEYQQMLDDAGNVILLKTVESADGTGTTIAEWYYPSDLTTQAVAPLNPTPIVANASRSILSSETLLVGNAAVGAPVVPATANYAEVFVNNADVLFTIDGADPDNTIGAKVGAVTYKEAIYKLESRDELLASKVIVNDDSETANLSYTYYLIV